MSIRGASPMLNTLANSRGDGGTPHPGRTCERRTNTVLTGRFGFHEGNRAPFAFPPIYCAAVGFVAPAPRVKACAKAIALDSPHMAP